MSKRQMHNPLKPKNKVINKKILDNDSKVIINFSYENWIIGESVDDFTTYTENREKYNEDITFILNTLLPYVYKKWSKDSQFGNCHSLNDFNKPRTREANIKYRKIIEKIHPTISTKKDDLELFQLGLKRSMRLICGKIDNTLYPLLIDHYHLGYDSKYHNQKDFTKFSYCPINNND